MPKFSRITIVELIKCLESLTTTEFDRMLLKYGLEEIAPSSFGSKPRRLNSLAKFLIENPDEKGPLGSNLIFELIEEEIKRRQPDNSIFGYRSNIPIEETHPELVNSLRRDGFVIIEGKLRTMLPEDIPLVEKENELNSLLDKFSFNTTKGHLNQAISAHTRGDWASANAQLRTFVESLFDSIADALVLDKTKLPSTEHKRRELLTELSPPFFIPSLNEWEIGDKGGFMQGFWRRLHPQGSHPGLSDEEDSTFRLHLVILVGHHLVKRLDERLRNA